MRTVIARRGPGASIAMHSAMIRDAGLRAGGRVVVRVERGRVVIEPVGPRRFDINDLIARITPENRHPEIDFGPPVGSESF